MRRRRRTSFRARQARRAISRSFHRRVSVIAACSAAARSSLHCALGRSGVTHLKREGDGATPAGRHRAALADRAARPRRDRARACRPARCARTTAGARIPATAATIAPIRLPSPAGHETMWRDGPPLRHRRRARLEHFAARQPARQRHLPASRPPGLRPDRRLHRASIAAILSCFLPPPAPHPRSSSRPSRARRLIRRPLTPGNHLASFWKRHRPREGGSRAIDEVCSSVSAMASGAGRRGGARRSAIGRAWPLLVQTSGCNDCHTEGYGLKEGDIPEERMAEGLRSSDGAGPWGNHLRNQRLRLKLHEMHEDEWRVQAPPSRRARRCRGSTSTPWTRATAARIYLYVTSFKDARRSGRSQDVPLVPGAGRNPSSSSRRRPPQQSVALCGTEDRDRPGCRKRPGLIRAYRRQLERFHDARLAPLARSRRYARRFASWNAGRLGNSLAVGIPRGELPDRPVR